MTVGLFLALKETAILFDQDTMPFNTDHFHKSDPVASLCSWYWYQSISISISVQILTCFIRAFVFQLFTVRMFYICCILLSYHVSYGCSLTVCDFSFQFLNKHLEEKLAFLQVQVIFLSSSFSKNANSGLLILMVIIISYLVSVLVFCLLLG